MIVAAGNGTKALEIVCQDCKGSGHIIEKPCNACTKTGFETKKTTLRVKIPLGIKDGDVLRVKGKGNAITDGSYGDLFVNVNVANVDKQFEF